MADMPDIRYSGMHKFGRIAVRKLGRMPQLPGLDSLAPLLLSADARAAIAPTLLSRDGPAGAIMAMTALADLPAVYLLMAPGLILDATATMQTTTTQADHVDA